MPDATERKVLASSAFIAGCLLIAPGQHVAAGVTWSLAAVLFVWHLLRSRREEEAGAGAGAAAGAAAGADAGADAGAAAGADAAAEETEGGRAGG